MGYGGTRNGNFGKENTQPAKPPSLKLLNWREVPTED